ncbi:MAG: SDR family oxidoreductase [Spirochaetota bacterium]
MHRREYVMDYLEELFGLSGKRVVITGGGGVIPGAMAEALLQAGAGVSLWGWREESLVTAMERLSRETGHSERLHKVVVDTSVEEEVRRAFAVTREEFGMPDVLVNGVGGTRGKSSFVDIDLNLFDQVMKLNLLAGLVVPIKVFSGHWIEQNVRGCMVNIASMASYLPLPGVWAYDAAKAGVLSLTQACAKEFAEYGIRVNAVAPGFFLGKQNRDLLIDKHTGELTPRGKAIIQHTPFGRFGEPSDLAGVVVFLVSEKASGFVTGISIPVDGGYLVHTI